MKDPILVGMGIGVGMILVHVIPVVLFAGAVFLLIKLSKVQYQ